MNKLRKIIVSLVGKKRIKTLQVCIIEEITFFYGFSKSVFSLGNKGELIRRGVDDDSWEFFLDMHSVERARKMFSICCAGYLHKFSIKLNNVIVFARVVK